MYLVKILGSLLLLISNHYQSYYQACLQISDQIKKYHLDFWCKMNLHLGEEFYFMEWSYFMFKSKYSIISIFLKICFSELAQLMLLKLFACRFDYLEIVMIPSFVVSRCFYHRSWCSHGLLNLSCISFQGWLLTDAPINQESLSNSFPYLLRKLLILISLISHVLIILNHNYYLSLNCFCHLQWEFHHHYL